MKDLWFINYIINTYGDIEFINKKKLEFFIISICQRFKLHILLQTFDI